MSGLAREARPAFYALAPGGARDYVTLLHPPYTAWHLAYVALGAGLARHVALGRLAWTVAAFALAVGVAAHALDELHGRPLGTRIPSPVLVALAAVALLGAVAIGGYGVAVVGPWLLAFVVVGVALVLAYDLELAGGVVHTDLGFALAWGAFPVLVGGFAQDGAVQPAVVAAAAFGCATSLAQRRLSNWARGLRRRAVAVEGRIAWRDGAETPVDLALLVRHADAALKLLALAHVLLAVAVVTARA